VLNERVLVDRAGKDCRRASASLSGKKEAEGRRLFFKEELAGAGGGFDNGFDESDAELAFFQLEDAVDGTACGSSDGVFEESGVVAGFEDDAGRAFHGLRGKEGGNIAREANFYASFGEGFENDVGESGAAGGKSGDGVHIFFVDDDGAANGVKHGLGDCDVRGGRVGTPADACHAAADGGAGVGHDADDGDFAAEMLLDVSGWDGCSDGNDESFFGEFGGNFF
jgi:hypothetical protein